jgi:hypothetical protein
MLNEITDVSALRARASALAQHDRDQDAIGASDIPGMMNKAMAVGFAQRFDGVRLTSFPEKGRRSELPPRDYEGSVEDNWKALQAAQAAGHGIHYYLNDIKPGPGSGRRGTANRGDIVAAKAVAVDVDDGEPYEFHIQPDFLIKTSVTDGVQHWQALWLVDPITPLEAVEDVAARLAIRYGGDKGIKRTLRLPGTVHWKAGQKPQLVTYSQEHTSTLPEKRRPIRVITEGLPDLPPRGEPKPKNEHREGTRDLREVLAWLDPSVGYQEWWPIIAAIEATPMGSKEERETIAIEWSRGDYSDLGTPSNWTSDESVRSKFQSFVRSRMDREANGETIVSFGSLVQWAREAGMPEGVAGALREARPDIFDAFLETGNVLQKMDDGQDFLDDIDAIDRWPDPAFLVDGLLVQGEDCCLYSQPKEGKTFLALDIAMSIAAGIPVLSRLTVRRPGECVVYLTGEGHAGFKLRTIAWRKAKGISTAQLRKFFAEGPSL